MNVTFASFQGITKGIPTGMAKFLMPILEQFKNKNFVYYVRVLNNYKSEIKIKDLGWVYNYNSFFIKAINRFILKIPPYRFRLINEKLFDFFLSKKINKPTVLISTAFLVKTLKKNKQLGGINIFLAGNPDDYDINQLLVKEQIKHSVTFSDAYTYKPRIAFGTKSILGFDHIIAVTISEYESFKKRIPIEKLSYIESHIIPNSQSFPEIEVSKDEVLTFSFVAHPFWLKGLPYLLEAWSKIETKNVKLKIAGRIDKQMQKFITKNYSTLSNIEYLGFVDDLNAFYRTSHVCIIPSLLDAGPATVAEAMYCSLPVIVSDGCGARTLIKDGKNGFVVPAANSGAIAAKMGWFSQNKQLIPKMGKEAVKSINKLTNKNQELGFEQHLIKIIDSLRK